jgi:prephenate dehydrogenase
MNKPAIEALIGGMIARLGDMKERLHSDTLGELFEQAQRSRQLIPAGAKGFIGKLSEVLVLVKDQPGMIARIASSLAEKDINIKDIEVLKVREGEGGTIRLAFDSAAVARAAVAELQKAGFSARERT